MNANPNFLAATAHVDDAAVQPLPSSSKIYVGPLRVPMREIAQSADNPPILVYDTSGPYTDPAAKIDIRAGLAPLRAPWITARDDNDVLDGPSSEYGRKRLEDPRLAELRPDRGADGRTSDRRRNAAAHDAGAVADVDRDRNEILQKASTKMSDVVKKLAEEKGLDVVIDVPYTVYSKPALDITNDAIAAYDKAYPAK